MSAQQSASTPGRSPRKKAAGVFDVRVLIGVLLGIYGVILLLMGLFATTDEELSRADGVNVNLWTGIGLILASAVFIVWARLRPVLVPIDQSAQERDEPDTPPH